MSRRKLLLAATMVLLTGGTLVAASPAIATTVPDVGDAVALSLDGRFWAQDLTDPLFDEDLRWVPGDRRQASFFVRNSGQSDAELFVAIDVEGRVGSAAHAAVDLALHDGETEVDTVAYGSGVALGRIREGAVKQVDVSALFRGDAGNETMEQYLHFRLTVTLSGSPSVPTDTSIVSGSPERPDAFAVTGDSTFWSALVVGLALMTTGTISSMRARGRQP